MALYPAQDVGCQLGHKSEVSRHDGMLHVSIRGHWWFRKIYHTHPRSWIFHQLFFQLPVCRIVIIFHCYFFFIILSVSFIFLLFILLALLSFVYSLGSFGLPLFWFGVVTVNKFCRNKMYRCKLKQQAVWDCAPCRTHFSHMLPIRLVFRQCLSQLSVAS